MSSNERYYCHEKDCEIVPSGLHGTYFVCRKCKMETTEKLKIQKDQEKKDKSRDKLNKSWSELDLVDFEEVDRMIYSAGSHPGYGVSDPACIQADQDLIDELFEMDPDDLDELEKAFRDMVLAGQGAVKVDDTGIHHIDPRNYIDDDFQSALDEFNDDHTAI